MRVKLPGPVAAIYKAVEELSRAYKSRKFTPDGHLVGSIGEVAAKALGLKLHRGSHPCHDAVDTDGRHVQIKMTARSRVSLYANCERLVVLQVVSPSEAEIVYDGPGGPVWAAAGRPQKNGQSSVSISRLHEIAKSQKSG